MPDRMPNIGFVGNGKGTNRYHAPFFYETIANGAPQLVRPEETIAQLRILEMTLFF